MTSLFAWLWQGVLLAALVDLLLRVTPRVNAATRHAIWWVALLGIASIPLAGYVPDGLLHLASGTAAMPPSAGVVNSGGLIELPRLPDWIPAVLLGLWGVTVLRGAARLWKGIVAIRRLESGSHPMPEARQARLPSWTTWRRRGRRAELRLSDEYAGAAALGFGSPVILVSARLAEALEEEELDAIVMHEYAHLARRDDWSCLLQLLIESVAGLHPAVALVARRIDVEREAACDDWVVGQAMSTRRYAACLAELAALVKSRPERAADVIVPGATGSQGSLYTRVRRLLDGEVDRGRRIRRAPFSAAAAGAGSILLLALTSHPLVTFVHAAAVELPAASVAVVPVAPAAPREAAQEAPVLPRTPGPRTGPPPSQPGIAGEPVDSSRPRRLAVAPVADGVDVATPPSHEQPTLAARSFSQIPHPAPVATPPAQVAGWPIEPAARDSAWGRMAAAGTQVATSTARTGPAVGQRAKKAGLSVAGFFMRAGKGVASSF